MFISGEVYRSGSTLGGKRGESVGFEVGLPIIRECCPYFTFIAQSLHR